MMVKASDAAYKVWRMRQPAIHHEQTLEYIVSASGCTFGYSEKKKLPNSENNSSVFKILNEKWYFEKHSFIVWDIFQNIFFNVPQKKKRRGMERH